VNGFASHHNALFVLAQKMCGNRFDAQDLVQDTYERALRSSARFAPGTNAAAWLATILRRLFVDAYRRQRRITPVALDGDQFMADEPEVEPVWASLGSEEIESALASLDEPFKKVFVLHELEGRSYTEIAAALRIPKATVGTRLARARRKLRNLLCS
jgi:RNA polymerase sigma-70 factor, ECF subfamily